MRQFILPDDWKEGSDCELAGGRAHYLQRVLRLIPGDVFPGVDASGRRWLCKVEESGPGRIRLRPRPLPADFDVNLLPDIHGGRSAHAGHQDAGGGEGADSETALDLLRSPVASGKVALPHITLVQGLSRPVHMDLVVRQAAETGVSRILPLCTRRSLPARSAEGGGREARWERIAREARQQSGSAIATDILPPLELKRLPGLLGPRGTEVRVLLHERPPAPPLEQGSLHRYLDRAPGAIVVCIRITLLLAPSSTGERS